MSGASIDRESLASIEEAPPHRKLALYLRLMGPSWLGIALNIGGATFVTGAVLGSATGVNYLWLVTLSVVSFWVMMMGTMKLMLSYQQPLVKVIKDNTHRWVGLVVAAAILIVNGVFHTTQMYLSAAWLDTLFGYGLVPWMFVTVLVVSVMVFPGRTRRWQVALENIMKGLILLLVLSMAFMLLYLDIDWGSVLAGMFVPTLPSSGEELTVVLGAIGASIAITVPAVASYGWRVREWDTQFTTTGYIGVGISTLVFLLVNWAVIIVFAFTLNRTGQVPGSPIEGALALQPLVGEFAFVLFGFGLWAAVVTSITMQVTLTGYTVSDLCGWEIDPSARTWKIAGALTFVPAVIVPFIDASPFDWTVYGSALNSSFTFVFFIILVYLLRSKSLMGERRVSGLLYYGLIYALLHAGIVFVRFWVQTLGL